MQQAGWLLRWRWIRLELGFVGKTDGTKHQRVSEGLLDCSYLGSFMMFDVLFFFSSLLDHLLEMIFMSTHEPRI